MIIGAYISPEASREIFRFLLSRDGLIVILVFVIVVCFISLRNDRNKHKD